MPESVLCPSCGFQFAVSTAVEAHIAARLDQERERLQQEAQNKGARGGRDGD